MSKAHAHSVLFADISGSMRLFAEVGDTVGRQVVADCLNGWSRAVLDHDGEIVQLRGDGMLCVFPDAASALDAAAQIREFQQSHSVSMHAGIDTGPLKRDGEQLYGDVVNTAARICELAKAGEIVITERTRDQLPTKAQANLRLIKKVPLKGKSAPIDIFLVVESAAGITVYDPSSKTRTINKRLRLACMENVILLDNERPECVLGRQDDCDLIVDTDKASRRHASIQCKLGKFFLNDHSTNGTFVYDSEHAEPVLLQRDTVQLKGSGMISLGCEKSEIAAKVIRFHVG